MDTDLNHHMNNTNYIRLILDAQPSSFWDRYRVQEFDVHYVNEAVEGEEIQVLLPDGSPRNGCAD